jgi:hypothetical protein
MDVREQRGLVIAATANIVKAQRGAYYVPSATRAGAKYRVEPDQNRCDCKDYEAMGLSIGRRSRAKVLIGGASLRCSFIRPTQCVRRPPGGEAWTQ